MPEKKILYIINTLTTGGAERHLSYLLQYLDKERFTPYLACFQKKGCYLPELEKLGITIIDLGVRRRIYDLHGLRAFARLVKFIKGEGIELIHCYLFKSNIFGTAAARLCKVPVIISNRNVNTLLSPRQLKVYLWMARLATAVTAVSNEVKRLDVEKGIPPDKIVTIYNGIKPPQAAPPPDKGAAKRALGLEPDSLLVGTVANLQPRKGHKHLLDAAQKVTERLPRAQFLLLGSGHLEKELRGQAARLGVTSRVIFAGDREDIPRLLPLMDVFTLSSLAEGMSNALLEAMAAALPCVVTAAGGNGEVVIHDRTGLIVPPADSAALARALTELLQDRERAKEMGRRGQERIKECFTMEKMVAQIEKLYQNILSGRRQHFLE